MIVTPCELLEDAYRVLTPRCYVLEVKRAVTAALLAAAALPCAAFGGPLRTAVLLIAPTADPLVFQRMHEAGATVVRINLSWQSVAPARLPAGFRPADPADPAYNWSKIDREVTLAAEQHLQPLLTVYAPPLWAQKDEPHPTHLGPYPIDSWRPDPAQLRAFAHAAAARYGGAFAALPRVRYWEVWNEPNLSQYLSPQLDRGKVVSPDVYRALVNAFADAAHEVHADNVVAAGSLSAFSFLTPYGRLGIAPMLFMRRLLCMSAGAHPKSTCNETIHFDAWSHHPWTSGGPTHHASEKDDVSFGDLPEMHRLLVAAHQAGHIRSSRTPEFWITEFAWDTRPPDSHPETAPIALQSRWVSEALYRSWKMHIGLFTWLMIWDEIYPGQSLQSGLFFRNGEDFRYAQPKPTFFAFRFPFVAYRRRDRIAVWGETPHGRPSRVAVQQRIAGHWRSAGGFETDRYGVFRGSVPFRRLPKMTAAARPPATAAYRALVLSAAPSSYWPLDERSGETAADARHADDGRFDGNVRLGVPGAIPGSTAIALDGKTARVRLGAMPNVHSVELWVRSDSRIDGAVFSNRNTVHAYTYLGGNGGLAFSYDDYPIFAGSIAIDRWHHVVYTYDSTTSAGRIYVDGRLSNFAVYPRREGGAAASIGYDATLRAFFKGRIDEVAVYPYPLSPEQVRSHYLASGRRIPSAVPDGMLRAVDLRSGSASLPFSLVRPPDRYVLPFGG